MPASVRRPAAMDAELSACLRQATAALHRDVERHPFMRALLHGRLELRAYATLLRNLHEIYATLEPALARRATAWRVPLPLPELARTGALRADLTTLHGPGWRRALPCMPATARYCARVRAVAAVSPLRLLAHAYVRYVGDLSGGQVLRRVLVARLGVGAEAARFYDFGAPATVAALKESLRAAMDSILTPAAARGAIVGEALWAFRQHGHLFDELHAATSPRASRAAARMS